MADKKDTTKTAGETTFGDLIDKLINNKYQDYLNPQQQENNPLADIGRGISGFRQKPEDLVYVHGSTSTNPFTGVPSFLNYIGQFGKGFADAFDNAKNGNKLDLSTLKTLTEIQKNRKPYGGKYVATIKHPFSVPSKTQFHYKKDKKGNIIRDKNNNPITVANSVNIPMGMTIAEAKTHLLANGIQSTDWLTSPVNKSQFTGE